MCDEILMLVKTSVQSLLVSFKVPVVCCLFGMVVGQIIAQDL
jgi:hypothetical protein